MGAAQTMRVALAGAGRMGGALLSGWLEQGLDPAGLLVFEPAPSPDLDALAAEKGVRVAASPDPRDGAVDVLILAVKPQVMAEAAPAYRPLIGPETLILSIAAGRPLSFLVGLFGPETAIVRAMPNTPAAIHRAMTVACPNGSVGPDQRARADRLLSAVGEVAWVQDEALMDAVTAVSGSGPAYVFLLAECLAKAGTAAGLPADLAERLARATVAGAGELLRRSDESAETLRRNVTSPGGTTEAALDVLMGRDGLESLMERAVASATRRSRELA